MWLILMALTAGGEAADDALQTRFQRMDRDGNGFITANEAPRLPQTRCRCARTAEGPVESNWIGDYDRNGDARVNVEEFLRRASAEAAELSPSRATANLAAGFDGSAPDN